MLNLRGVKESVQILMPVFLLFLLTHLVLIVGSIAMHLPAAGAVAEGSRQRGPAEPSPTRPSACSACWPFCCTPIRSGAGTYTGLEAVSNSMPVMREPRVATAKRTMLYMAVSLAFTAGGLIIAYLLLDIRAPRTTRR